MEDRRDRLRLLRAFPVGLIGVRFFHIHIGQSAARDSCVAHGFRHLLLDLAVAAGHHRGSGGEKTNLKTPHLHQAAKYDHRHRRLRHAL